MAPFTLAELRRLPRDAFYFTRAGKPVDLDSVKEEEDCLDIQAHLRILGGKGGFGSLLKSFKFHTSDNQDSCRDLSGRRLGQVKEEERLRAWIAKKADREAAKEKKKNARYERLKAGQPKHVFNDPTYTAQGEAILETVEDAVAAGIRTAQRMEEEERVSGAAKRRAEEAAKAAVLTKKLRSDDPWLAADLDADDIEEDSDEGEAEEMRAEEGGAEEEPCTSWLYQKPAEEETEAEPNLDQEAEPEPNLDQRHRSSVRSFKAAAEAHKAKLMRMLQPKEEPPVVLKSYERKGEDSAEEATEPMVETEPPTEPPKEATKKPATTPASELDLASFQPIDLEDFASAAEIQESHSPDHLKAELIRRQLKCGGSAEERSKRLWLVRGIDPANVPKKLRASAK